MNCILKISQIYNELTIAEKKIADVISNEPEKAINFTADQLAKYSKTSAPSVIRFAKKIGCKGYNSMKIELARNLEAKDTPQITTLLKSDDSLEIVSKKVVKNIESTLEQTLDLIDFKNVIKAVDTLKKANNIYLFGVGASAIVALDFQQKLARINKKCTFYMDYHLGVSTSVHIKSIDVVVAFSYHGQTREVNEAVIQAKLNGATCIAVTRCLNSPLHQLADILIILPDTENELRIGAVTSRYTQLLIADILFAGIAKENFEIVQQNLIKTREMVEKLKKY